MKIRLPRPSIAAISYVVFRDVADRITPYLRGLQLNLLKAKMGTPFKVYVSLLLFTASLAFAITLSLTVPLFLYVLKIGLNESVLYGFLLSMGVAGLTFALIYSYPSMLASSLKGKIESSLPFGANYLAIFTSAGISPDRIFQSLSKAKDLPGMDVEAQMITRDVTLFGDDILTAIEKASQRTPSPVLSELLDGYISTVRGGGDVTTYMLERARQAIERYRMFVRRFIDSLSFIAQIYIALMVAAPLVLIVMFLTTGILGGGLGGLTATMLLALLTYVFIPLMTLVFLIWIHLISPRRG
jgi:flagellar protein FlaJ